MTIFLIKKFIGTIVFTQAPRIFSTSVTFKWNAPAEMTFECSLDKERYQPCGEGRSGQWTRKNVPDGKHSFKVKATDNDGNVVEAEIRGWIVDTVLPVIMFTDPPIKTSDSAELRWVSSEQANFECSLDSEPYTNCGEGLTSGKWIGDNLSRGVHVFKVKGKDAAGNIGEPARHVWTVGG